MMFKTPWCGCCIAWTEAVQRWGYAVTVRDLNDLTAINAQASVPDALQACHTAVLDDLVLEGHVLVAAIDKLMREPPVFRGIAVPGMPPGSLGMGEDPQAPYSVYAFDCDPSFDLRVFFEAEE